MSNKLQKRPADHPYVRKSKTCLLCSEVKPIGLVVCWGCFREHALRNVNAETEALLDEAEDELREYFEVDSDDENIYNLPGIRQSIEERK